MREKILKKIDEVIETIIAKDPKDITYNEYRILDARLASIKYEEEQQKRNEDFANLLGKAMGSTFIPQPAPLPESTEE